MCKDLCEQSDEGRQLWERWRTHGDNWQAVSRFHRDAVIAAMRADAIKRQTESLARGGPYMLFLCPRDEEQAERARALEWWDHERAWYRP